MKIACFSVAALDYFPQRNEHFAGGNSLNQAIRFRQMGLESAFIGALGTNDSGDKIAALLESYAVDVTRLHRLSGNTARNQIINDEQGERFGVEGAWDGGVYEDYVLDADDWNFIAGFDIWSTHVNCPSYQQALERKSPKQFMAVDFLHLKDYELLRRSLGVVDIAYFGGTGDMADELAQIAKDYSSVIVLTLGAGGSIAFKGNQVYKQKALPIEKVVDTTGCGDAFQAAFTAQYFTTQDIQVALKAAAESGREAATHYGGSPFGTKEPN